MKEYQKKRYDERMAYAKETLGGKCVQCSTTEDLEVDHIDPKTKSAKLSDMTNLSLQAFDLELGKCQLLCVKCHALKSVKDAGKNHAEHGTLAGYKNCRCDLCRKAQSDYCKEYNSKRKTRGSNP